MGKKETATGEEGGSKREEGGGGGGGKRIKGRDLKSELGIHHHDLTTLDPTALRVKVSIREKVGIPLREPI